MQEPAPVDLDPAPADLDRVVDYQASVEPKVTWARPLTSRNLLKPKVTTIKS